MFGKWADEMPPDKVLYKLRVFRLIWKFVRNQNISQMTIRFYKSLYRNKENLK